MPNSIDGVVYDHLKIIWQADPSQTSRAVYQAGRKHPQIGRDRYSERTVNNLVRKWKSELVPLEPDRMLEPWSEDWGHEAERIKTLLVLHDVARSVCLEFGITPIGGLTEGVSHWACKLRAFFDLSIRLDCLMLLYFAYSFNREHRFAKEMKEPFDLDTDVSKELMAWHWRDHESTLPDQSLEQEDTAPLWMQEEEYVAWVVANDFSPTWGKYRFGDIGFRLNTAVQEEVDHGNA
jgi:hypothetical protein